MSPPLGLSLIIVIKTPPPAFLQQIQAAYCMSRTVLIIKLIYELGILLSYFIDKETETGRLDNLSRVSAGNWQSQDLNPGSLAPESRLLTTMLPLRSPGHPWSPGPSLWSPLLLDRPLRSSHAWSMISGIVFQLQKIFVATLSIFLMLEAWVREIKNKTLPFSYELLLLIIRLLARATRVWIYEIGRKTAEFVAEEWRTPNCLDSLLLSQNHVPHSEMIFQNPSLRQQAAW